MKPDSVSELSVSAIQKTLAAYGVATTTDQATILLRHAQMVLSANARLNLTRIVESTQVLQLHIADSALALSEVYDSPAGLLFDLGSGAGYPAVVLGVLSKRHLVMIESVKKKASFLEGACAELQLDAEVLADRAEDVALTHAGVAAVLTARAVTSLPALVELSAPLLMQGGRLVALKARIEPTELAEGRRAASLCGMLESDVIERRLGSEHIRTLVVYERVGKPSVTLPRRSGMAQRSPLGR